MRVDRVRNALRERITARARDAEPRRARLREVEGVRSALGRARTRHARRSPATPPPPSAAPRTAR